MLLEKGETIDYAMQYYECDDLSVLRLRNGKTFSINKSALGVTWLLVSNNDSTLFNKLVSQGVKLGSFSKISNGIKSGEDSVFILNKNADTGSLAEAELLKNYLKNSDIHRYYIDEPSKKILYSCSATELDDYPIFKLYISRFKEVLEKKWSQRGEDNDYWKLYRAREDIYQSTRQLIVTPYRTNNIGFALNMGCLSGTDTYIILNRSENINEFVLLALLNSKLIRWFYERIGKRKGKIFEIATKELSSIPIIFPNEAVSDKITGYVKEIIETMSSIHSKKLDIMVISSLQEKSSKNIALIDHEVYDLYGLTEEEIKIVEEFTRDRVTHEQDVERFSAIEMTTTDHV